MEPFIEGFHSFFVIISFMNQLFLSLGSLSLVFQLGCKSLFEAEKTRSTRKEIPQNDPAAPRPAPPTPNPEHGPEPEPQLPKVENLPKLNSVTTKIKAYINENVLWMTLQDPNQEFDDGKPLDLYFGQPQTLPSKLNACEQLPHKTSIPKWNHKNLRYRLSANGQKIEATKDVVLCLAQSSKLHIHYQKPVKRPPLVSTTPIHRYGALCEDRIGPVPPLNCLDGDVLEITLNGKPLTTDDQPKECDHPIMLGLPNGQCITGSRLLVTDTDDPDVRLVMICRRYLERSIDSPNFDDVAVIHYRISTGDTCFYQMPNRVTDTSRIPPPAELAQDTPQDAWEASKFWLTPQETVDRACFSCHDSDPFIYNPYIAQPGTLPSFPMGKYVIIGEEFQQWPPLMNVETDPPNSCSECHRIGNHQTCQNSIKYATGMTRPPGISSQAYNLPNAIWMPPDHGEASKELWQNTYRSQTDAILRCCNDPTQRGCRQSPIGKN